MHECAPFLLDQGAELLEAVVFVILGKVADVEQMSILASVDEGRWGDFGG